VPHFPDDTAFPEYAIEVSHHVKQKVMGVSEEHPENITFIIPVLAAQKLVDAKNMDQKQAAVLESRVFLNGKPTLLWLKDGAPTDDWIERYTPAKKQAPAPDATANVPTPPSQTVSSNLLKSTPMRLITPEALAKLQTRNEHEIDRMVKGLDKEAHFIPYAPQPSFVAFRQGAYLQLSINTKLDTAPPGQFALQTRCAGFR
jgi:hypothetical protein